MAWRRIVAGSTSVLIEFPVYNSSSTTGALLTGLAYNTSGLTAYYYRSGASGSTSMSLATMTLGTWATLGFVAVDGTNMPGIYQLGVPNAALATGATAVTIYLQGATNMVPVVLEIELTSVADYPANVTQLLGTAWLTPGTAGTPDVNAKLIGGQTAGLDGNNLLKVDVVDWNGTAVSSPATAGIPDVNVKNINNVAAATPGASGGVLISGSNAGTTTLGALTVTGATTHTGNVSMAAGLTITQSTTNADAVDITGNGTGSGMVVKSGSGATGDGVKMISQATAGNGLTLTHNGSSVYDLNAQTTNGLQVNTTAINSVSASSVTTINANQGTTQPLNFTGTGASALVKVDVDDWNGTAVSSPATAGIPDVNVKNWAGTAAAGSNGSPPVSVRKNTALANFEFLMTDSTAHAPKTGLGTNVTVTRSIDGGAFSAGTLTSVTELGNGIYLTGFAAADLNGGVITLQATASGCDTTFVTLVTAQ